MNRIISPALNTMIATSSVYILFLAGFLYLFMGVPYSVFKFFNLSKFSSRRMYYVYEQLDFVDKLEDKTIYLKKKDKAKLQQVIDEIQTLPSGVSAKIVKRKVEKICKYTPDWKLYLLSFLLTPVTANFCMFLSVSLGDNSFLGFFFFLGFLATGPVLFVLLSKVNAPNNKAAHEEIQQHTAHLLESLQNR